MLAVGAVTALWLVTPALAAHAQRKTPQDFVPPVVLQAAGPTAASIQGAVDTVSRSPFRDARDSGGG